MNNSISKKLSTSIIMVILTVICFTVTTLAIVVSMLSVDGNIFITGRVEINLNDGKPLVGEGDRIVFEPGMTEERSFFIENKSTCDVYYKLYFENVRGSLADQLVVRIYSGEKLLVEGTPRTLVRENSVAVDDVIKRMETRDLRICLYLPEDAKNLENSYFSFDFVADATQAKNNPGKEFN